MRARVHPAGGLRAKKECQRHPSWRLITVRVPRRLAVLALGTSAALAVSVAAPSAASAASPAAAKPLGTKSLASVLLADKTGFDHNDHDYDVVTAAVLAVLKAKPKSAVSVLTDGRTPVTAFVPNDHAFRVLVHDLTGKSPRAEKDVFAAVASLGIPTVEKVLLYHVVPGATITAKAARGADGAKLRTAEGGSLTVDVSGHGRDAKIRLVDADRDDRNPRVVAADINSGNRQIAHGIDRVLRPINLP
jgi:uncharacterized surface protein with fasciclin (FAS1) repeats